MLKRISFLTIAFLLVASVSHAQVYIKSNPSSTGSGPGTGDVNGPGSATDGASVCFDGTTGKLIKECAVSFAPANATYIVQTANGSLSAEQALGALGTGILISTTTTGVVSIKAANTCTNQFPRSDTASGVWTCASVANADLAGSIAATKLVGTDIAVVGTITTGVWTGTDIVFANIVPSSAASRLVGRGSASGAGDFQELTVGAGLTISGTVLSATGSGAGDVVGPASAVSGNIATFDGVTGKLIEDSGVAIGDLLPITGTPAQGDIFYFDGSDVALLVKSASATRYLSNTGTSNNPAWAQINLTNGVTGLLPIANQQVIWLFGSGIVQAATASVGFGLPTDPAVAVADSNTNVHYATADFADGSTTLNIDGAVLLPSGFTALDINGMSFNAGTSTNNFVMVLSIRCWTPGAALTDSWVTAATITDAGLGTANALNTWSSTGVTTTGCSAGDWMFWNLARTPGAGGDTLAQTVKLLGVYLVVR